jgi:hypothetical protein
MRDWPIMTSAIGKQGCRVTWLPHPLHVLCHAKSLLDGPASPSFGTITHAILGVSVAHLTVFNVEASTLKMQIYSQLMCQTSDLLPCDVYPSTKLPSNERPQISHSGITSPKSSVSAAASSSRVLAVAPSNVPRRVVLAGQVPAGSRSNRRGRRRGRSRGDLPTTYQCRGREWRRCRCRCGASGCRLVAAGADKANGVADDRATRARAAGGRQRR